MYYTSKLNGKMFYRNVGLKNMGGIISKTDK